MLAVVSCILILITAFVTPLPVSGQDTCYYCDDDACKVPFRGTHYTFAKDNCRVVKKCFLYIFCWDKCELYGNTCYSSY